MRIGDPKFTHQQWVDAMVRANDDIPKLVRLIRAGKVKRYGPATALVHEVLSTMRPVRRTINLAIRPKRRRR